MIVIEPHDCNTPGLSWCAPSKLCQLVAVQEDRQPRKISMKSNIFYSNELMEEVVQRVKRVILILKESRQRGDFYRTATLFGEALNRTL
jgi:hypothetical protein